MALNVGKLCGEYIDRIYIKEDKDKGEKKRRNNKAF